MMMRRDFSPMMPPEAMLYACAMFAGEQADIARASTAENAAAVLKVLQQRMAASQQFTANVFWPAACQCAAGSARHQ